jgi:hypothetical protein
MPRQNSYTWFFFDRKTYLQVEKKLKCSICNAMVKYILNGSTGSLRHHLVHEHNVTQGNFRSHTLFQQNLKSSTQNANDEQYSTDSNNTPDSNSKSYLMSCLIDFILCTDQSFSLLENKNFISFVRGLNKNFKIPSRKTFCDSILHSKVNILNHHVFIV